MTAPQPRFTRPPHEPVYERVLKRGQRRLAGRCAFHQPVGIVAPRMGHREEHGQRAAWLVHDWRGKRSHNDSFAPFYSFCASLGLVLGVCNARAPYSLLAKRIW